MGERMKSSDRWNDAKDKNSIWERVKKWNRVIVITKEKIKFDLGTGEKMKSSYRWKEAEINNSIWEQVKEWNQVIVKTK